jgi:hypothetical protein
MGRFWLVSIKSNGEKKLLKSAGISGDSVKAGKTQSLDFQI